MKRSWIFSVSVCMLAMLIAAPLFAHAIKQKKSSAAERKLRAAMMMDHHFDELPLDLPIPKRAAVKRLIWKQLKQGYRSTEATLGRAAVYFPVFEHYLQLYRLPVELKCIPFVESRLLARAQSSAGARGLWQFMDYTARAYNLEVNETTDERLDPLRSTEAAMRLLTDLYDEFENWLLALAAYNCGPGNVRKAIRLAGSRNYWQLEQYLPRQTRHYIPAFFAAVYVVKHYEQHGLQPKPYEYEFTHVRALPARDTFHHLNSVTPYEPQLTMRLPNSSAERMVIPDQVAGNHLAPLEWMRHSAIAARDIPDANADVSPHNDEDSSFSIYPRKTFFDYLVAWIFNPASYYS